MSNGSTNQNVCLSNENTNNSASLAPATGITNYTPGALSGRQKRCTDASEKQPPVQPLNLVVNASCGDKSGSNIVPHRAQVSYFAMNRVI